MPTTTTTCPLCEALCGLQIDHLDRQVTGIRGNPGDVLSRGHICPKAVALGDLHGDPDRLRQPMRRVGEDWVAISWSEALDEVASRLAAIQEQHGRHAVGVYAGNPTAHNYGAVLAGTLLQGVVRTHNRFSATSVDQLPHMFAALFMFGHQLLLPIPDVDHSDLFIILGGNPLVSNGSLMTAPGMKRRLKAIQDRGGRVVVIDPRRTETADVADAHHFIRPGSDALLLLAMLNTVFTEDLSDKSGAWRSWSKGLDTLEAAAAPWPAERVADATGIDAASIRQLARDLAGAKRGVLYPRIGTSTQRFGGLCAWLSIALNAVTGHLDTPGGMMWTAPAVDLVAMGARAGQTGHYAVRDSRVSGLPEFGGEFPAVALAEEISTPGEGQIRALMTLAGNPVLSVPNGNALAEALPKLEFYVAIDPYITATTRHADIILPPVSHLEREHFGLVFHAVAVRNTIKWGKAVFPAPEGGLDDWQILAGLARRMARIKKVPGPLKAAIATFERLGPRGVVDFVLKSGRHGVLRHPFGKRLSVSKLEKNPDGIDLGALTPSMPDRLYTPDDKADLAPDVLIGDLARLEAALDNGDFGREGELLLIGRRQLRSNNSWLHNSQRMVKGKPRCTLLMHPSDAAARSVTDGDRASLSSRVGAIEVSVEVSDEMMPGVVSLPHGWGHGAKGARMQIANATDGPSANDVTDDKLMDELTGTSVLNGVPVQVAAAGVAA